jgi:hypothetical protein
MLFIFLYLTFLLVAPQLWIEPFVGLRTDLVLFPAWIAWLGMSGRFGKLFKLGPQDAFFLGFLAWLAVTILVNKLNDRSFTMLADYAKWFVLFRLIVVTLDTQAKVRATLLMLLGFALVLAVQGIQQFNSEDGIGWAGQGLAWLDDEAKKAGLAGRTRWINIFVGPGV